MALQSPDDYEPVRLLTEGNFSDATLVRRKADEANFVVKKVNLTRILEPKYRQIAGEEADILTNLHHPNIVRVHNHFCERNQQGNLIYHLVVEQCENNWTLADEIEKIRKSNGFFSENHVLWWSNQLISALKYLHSRDILHRNVRPNNIYLINGNRDIKLGEFGFVKHEENAFVPQEPDTACAMGYLSPELVAGNHAFCKKDDLWALGVVLFETVSQKLPQNHNSPKLGFPPKTSNVYSKELLSFIRWTLSTDVDERPENINEVATHTLINDSRVDQIRTLFGLPPPSDVRSIKTEEEFLEPWKFHGRSSNVKATPSWISALLDVKSKDYVLACSYSGHVTAMTRSGDAVLWKAKVLADGARGGLWHAALDEKRGRLLVCYNSTDDPVNVYPVDIFSVPLEVLEPRPPKTPPPEMNTEDGEHAASRPTSPPPAVDGTNIRTVRAELFFHHDDWRCYGLRIDPTADLLYVCDWFDNKIGIFNLEGLQCEAAPLHVIGKPEQFKHFNPTRCAFITAPPKPKPEGEDATVVSADGDPKEQFLAVSDWLRSRIYLFRMTAIRKTINHEFESIITSKGEEVGLVAAPIDLQVDPTARTLIVCDQANARAQVFIPEPDWPHFKAIATENLGGHFSAVAITEVESAGAVASKSHSQFSSRKGSISGATKDEWESSKMSRRGSGANNTNVNIRVLMAGLNTGEVYTYKFKSG